MGCGQSKFGWFTGSTQPRIEGAQDCVFKSAIVHRGGARVPILIARPVFVVWLCCEFIGFLAPLGVDRKDLIFVVTASVRAQDES
jgi:hypothetical protein